MDARTAAVLLRGFVEAINGDCAVVFDEATTERYITEHAQRFVETPTDAATVLVVVDKDNWPVVRATADVTVIVTDKRRDPPVFEVHSAEDGLEIVTEAAINDAVATLNQRL